MPTRAVLFDLDDTLASETSLTPTALLHAARTVQVTGVSPRDLAAAAQHAARQRWWSLQARTAPRAVATWIDNVGIGSPESLWATFASDGPNPVLAWLRAHRGVLRRMPWIEAAATLGTTLTVQTAGQLAEQFVRARSALQQPAEGAVQVLNTLRERGLRTAIVTNGLPDLQRRKLTLTGLGDLVDAVVISGDSGLGKPHPAPFNAALSRLGVPASNAIMVGDSLANDIRGAKAAGLEAIWLSTDADRESDEHTTITALPDLLRLL